ncbi:Outer membrane protein TolC [Salinimicrobium catena]|uniref:Outer membrane protein TolC n=2 Tax=Salinimicrobium catena TaxID=390640 RepID=A0A1H5K209_9FLAO|nr:Outer membrane protein TolC [Salinimicrobium catena]SEE58028.1 Outer membrane protein TolC [Salinimicrobium catena]
MENRAVQIKCRGLSSRIDHFLSSFQPPTSNFRFKLMIILGLFFSANGLSQQLETYIQEAEQNNPEISAFELRYELASEKVNEVNTLPDTEFSAGYFVSEPETRTGAQKARFSVRQMIPWFGTITARENYAASMADAEYIEIAVAKRKLALSVAQSYYRLYSLQERQEVLLENIELLEVYHELAINSLEVGSASAVDVLRLQMRQNELAQQKQTLEQEFDAERVNFNNLLNRREDMNVMVVDSMAIPQEEVLRDLSIAEVHPELLKFDRLYESVAEAELLNQKEALPKLGFGIDYIPVAERTDMIVDESGKDILMPMVSVSIPIFNNKYKSVSRQNEIKQQEIAAQRAERVNKLETLLAMALNNRASAKITANTFLRNIEQAKDAEEILVRSYETGTIDFNDVLDVQELQLKFQTGLIEAVKNYYQQTALVNYLTN